MVNHVKNKLDNESPAGLKTIEFRLRAVFFINDVTFQYMNTLYLNLKVKEVHSYKIEQNVDCKIYEVKLPSI